VPLPGGGFIIAWNAAGSDGVRRNYWRLFQVNALVSAP